MKKLKLFIILTFWTSCHLSSLQAMQEGEILQPMEGNYCIKHASPTLDKSLLTWESEKENKKAPAGYYAQIINKSAEIQNQYVQVEQWIITNLWSILPAEDNCYTIKNVALDCGLLGALPEDNHVQVLDGERYKSSQNNYVPGGNLRNSVLWRIEKDALSNSYTIRSKRNNGFLSLSTSETFFGENLSILEDHPNQSYLSKHHKMREVILWDFVKEKLYK